MMKRFASLLLFIALMILLPTAYALNEQTYSMYLSKYAEIEHPFSTVFVSSVDILDGDVELFEGREASVLRTEGTEVTYVINADETGLYAVTADYYALEGTGSAVEIELLIDGELPFDGAAQLVLPRLFRDANSEWKQDMLGNDLKPVQIEIPCWQAQTFFDVNGFTSGAYEFFLSKGQHTLTIRLVSEAVAFSGFTFKRTNDVRTYEDYLAENGRPVFTDTEEIIIEAEKPFSKSSSMLYALSDRSDAVTFPSDPLNKKLNTIGGENWYNAGQTLTWQFEIPVDGWYTLSFRYKQNYLRGLEVFRNIEIDGAVPYKEFDTAGFPYGVSWQSKTIGNENPCYVYLSQGIHTLSMTPTTGDMAPLMRRVNTSVGELNELYRRIIMITGTTPDLFRDYYLYESIPGFTETLTRLAGDLRSVVDEVNQMSGVSGTEAAALERIAEQLESFAKLPDTVPERLSNFRDNIVSISSWVLTIQRQSLLLDRIYFTPMGTESVDANAGFGEQVAYKASAFAGSFTYDYESVGGSEDAEKTINVWITSGRDQAEVLKELIDSRFTPETGIAVKLSVVQSGLMQATMAGKGPDVALMIGHGDAVNYAIRGVALPLEGFDGFNELVAQYMSDAMIPFYYDGHCYGLPNSTSFYMMFYRTDIFEELNIKVPETWDELLEAAESLQRSNMNIGLPYSTLDAYASISTGIGGTSLFPTLLLQNDIGLYTDEGKTTLDTPGALHAFKTWTGYYTRYGFPLYKDDFTRFRTGEMPLVITNYTFYNQLDTAAPELNNLWKMQLIPGTPHEDGSVSHATAASGSAGMILSTTQEPDASWEFMKWWNSAEIQAEYGLHIESILGPAGRYNPANMEAFNRLPWSGEERRLILEQWTYVREIEELPGSYYVSRNIDNAFKAVFYDNENYREALNYWNRQINEELERKRQEFSPAVE